MDLYSGECEGLQLSGLQADTSAFSACSEEFDDIPESVLQEPPTQESMPPVGASTVSSRGSEAPCGAGMRNSSSSCEYVDYKQSSPSSEKSYQQSCASISEVHTLSQRDQAVNEPKVQHTGQFFTNTRDHEKSNMSYPAIGMQDEQQSQQPCANANTDSLRNAKAIRLSWLGKGSCKSSPAKKYPSKLKINLQAQSSDESEGDASDDGNDDDVGMLSQLLLDPRKTQQAILKVKGHGGTIHVNPLVREALNLIIARYFSPCVHLVLV
jgi:hypothetical protein